MYKKETNGDVRFTSIDCVCICAFKVQKGVLKQKSKSSEEVGGRDKLSKAKRTSDDEKWRPTFQRGAGVVNRDDVMFKEA